MRTSRLPGLDCGQCGYRTCNDLESALGEHPEHVERCLYLHRDQVLSARASDARPKRASVACGVPSGPAGGCACTGGNAVACGAGLAVAPLSWRDTLGRAFDFYLEHFPEDPGPREVILPRNPMIVRELDVKVGDVLLGRPLGMSCGCPITHCGVVTQVDQRTGVLTWCVTGPLETRQGAFKDLGYYSAEAYEGLVRESRCELLIGMRYFFQPRMCMLQWRHSGLVNYVNRTSEGLQIRLEGLWIG